MSSHLGSECKPARERSLARSLLRLAVLFALVGLVGAPSPANAQLGSDGYFTVTPDPRLCPSPTCGGFHLKAVNQLTMTCADGSQQTVCYVASADFGALEMPPAFAPGQLVVRGWIEAHEFPGFGNLGKLVAESAWNAATAQTAMGTFYRLRDLGIVCVAAPCFTMSAQILNQTGILAISTLDLSAVDATPAQLEAAWAAMRRGDLIVAGTTAPYSGTVGEGLALIASQFWLPVPAKVRCFSDTECPAGNRCNAGEVCLPPPGCEPGDPCPTVCSGYCEDAACSSHADCDATHYCASDGLCRSDGTCGLEVDCSLPGNDYPHIECVGHGICETSGAIESACGWECTNPMCVDLLGYDLGPCDAVLGWGVIGGACVEVSGCDAGPFALFASEDECTAACPMAQAVPSLGLPAALGLGVVLGSLAVAWSRRYGQIAGRH